MSLPPPLSICQRVLSTPHPYPQEQAEEQAARLKAAEAELFRELIGEPPDEQTEAALQQMHVRHCEQWEREHDKATLESVRQSAVVAAKQLASGFWRKGRAQMLRA